MDSSPAPSPADQNATAFRDVAEAQATATARALLGQAVRPALAELEALRVALDVRCQSLTATVSNASNIDPAPVRELVERLAHAAGEEAGAAARAARAQALEEADARVQIERAEAQKQQDGLRAEAAAAHAASQLELASLTEALEKATQQAESVRAERDAQIEALRAAREQADAIRADRDVQLENLRAANAQADTIRAERDAQLEALRLAAGQVAAIGAERDEHLRVAESAREEARTVQGEQDALLEAARISNARHTKLLEQAEARANAAHARAEETQAKFVEAQRQLAGAREELAAAQAEAERRLAVGAREIESLRTELERVRAELEAARPAAVAAGPSMETRIEETAVAAARPGAAVEQHVAIPAVFAHDENVEPAVEPATALSAEPPAPVELAVEPASERQVVRVVEQAAAPVFSQAEAAASEPAVQPEPAAVVALPEPAAVAALPEPTPFEEPAGVDPVRAMYQAISGAADLSQTLDALVDGVGALFPRAALFVVKTKSKRLQGWRSVGFTGPAAITREFEFPLATDSALTRAVSAGRTIFTGEGQPAQSGEAWTVTFPVTTGGRVVAVVHADAGGRSRESAQAFDRETALDLGHTLVRMAGERIGALTMSARAAFGNVMTTAPAAAPVAGAAPGVSAGPAASAAPAVPAVLAAGAVPAGSASQDIRTADSTATRAAGAHAVITDVNGTRVNGAAAALPAPPAPASLEDAGRYASQLVSELNRYNRAATTAPADQSLQAKLADQIQDARGTPAAQPPAGGSALGLFEEALGKMLNSGSIDAPVSVQPV